METTEHFNDYKAATKKPTCTANLDGKEVEGSSWMADYARSHRAGWSLLLNRTILNVYMENWWGINMPALWVLPEIFQGQGNWCVCFITAPIFDNQYTIYCWSTSIHNFVTVSMCLMSVLNKQKTLKIQYFSMTMCKCNTWGFSHEWSDYVK